MKDESPRVIDAATSAKILQHFRMAAIRRAQQWDEEREIEMLLGSTNPEDPEEPEEINVAFDQWAVGLDDVPEGCDPAEAAGLIDIDALNTEFAGTYIFTAPPRYQASLIIPKDGSPARMSFPDLLGKPDEDPGITGL